MCLPCTYLVLNIHFFVTACFCGPVAKTENGISINGSLISGESGLFDKENNTSTYGILLIALSKGSSLNYLHRVFKIKHDHSIFKHIPVDSAICM